MPENELLQKIEEAISSALRANENKKSRWLSLETIVKLGFALVMGAFAYAGMSNKIDNQGMSIQKIEQQQVKQSDRDDLRMSTMQLQIQTCQTQIAIINQQLKDLKQEQQ